MKKQLQVRDPGIRSVLSGGVGPVLMLVAIWIVMLTAANPLGNFPLNDDWSYAQVVKALVQQGRLEIPSIVTPVLIAQVLWGSLWCVIFGFSYNVLRFSTMVLGLVGIVGTYYLLREVGASRRMGFIGAAVVAVNPVYFELANTFMTDVPFYAFFVLGLYAFARGLRTDSGGWIACGTTFAVLATLTRQCGLVVPIAFTVAYSAKCGLRVKSVSAALLPTVIAGGALLGYQEWLKAIGKLPESYCLQGGTIAQFLSRGTGTILTASIVVCVVACTYVGLFGIPVLLAVFSAGLRDSSTAGRRLGFMLVLASLLWLVTHMLTSSRGMPLLANLGNILVPQGLGPPTSGDVIMVPGGGVPPLASKLWDLVTALGVIGASFLTLEAYGAARSLARWKRSGSPALVLFVTAGVLTLGAIIPLSAMVYYDRYFLPLAPLAMGMAIIVGGKTLTTDRLSHLVAICLLALYAVFSVGATHDYLASNRIRWRALDDLTVRSRIPASKIDGGYEFNGLFDYEGRVAEGWWHAVNDEYAVTLGPIPGYREIRRYPFRKWIPSGEGKILVLRKSD